MRSFLPVGGALAVYAFNKRRILQCEQSHWSGAFAHVNPRTLHIYCKENDHLMGCGFFYRGYLVTAAHLFETVPPSAKVRVVYPDGHCKDALLHGSSEYADVAVLKVDEKVHDLSVTIQKNLPQMGEEVGMFGTAKHCAQSVGALGIVAQPKQHFTLEEAFFRIRYLMVGFMTLPGMSGAPLMNAEGHVIGMMCKKFEDYGLALPISFVSHVADFIIDTGSWNPPVVGMALDDPRFPQVAPDAVKVLTVRAGGAASKAGIKEKDEIISINGVRTTSLFDVFEFLCETKETSVAVHLRRNGKTHTVHVPILREA